MPRAPGPTGWMVLRYRTEPKQLKKKYDLNDALLYSEIGVQFSGHQIGLIQQLVENNAETQNQILV